MVLEKDNLNVLIVIDVVNLQMLWKIIFEFILERNLLAVPLLDVIKDLNKKVSNISI